MASSMSTNIILVVTYLAFANGFIIPPPRTRQLQKEGLVVPLQLLSNSCRLQISSLSAESSSSSSSSRDGRSSSGPKNDSMKNNEFSRTIRVSKWFFGGGGGSSSSNNRGSNKMMDLQIFATPEERHALATRFRLSDIASLTADLHVQPALGLASDADYGECIEARGTVIAQVTQTCVRTNENFEIDIEFSFDTVIRAMAPTKGGSGGSSSMEDESEQLSAGELAALEAASKLRGGSSKQSNKKKGGKKQRDVKGVRGGQSSRDLDGTGMKQLQDILMEFEVIDEIIEDENCFCTDGIVDCGEIVAQMFRSKLDPYPKKPGSVSLFCASQVCF